jgi:hypothetical protein
MPCFSLRILVFQPNLKYTMSGDPKWDTKGVTQTISKLRRILGTDAQGNTPTHLEVPPPPTHTPTPTPTPSPTHTQANTGGHRMGKKTQQHLMEEDDITKDQTQADGTPPT